MRLRLLALVPVLLTRLLAQHGVNPIPVGAMHAQGNQIVDSTGQAIVLRGAEIPGLNLTGVSPAMQAIYDQTLSPTTFSTMRQRFNMNALRLPIASSIAGRDPLYLGRVATIVKQANVAGLVVILAEYGPSNLPFASEIDFWHTWASYFKDNPLLVFDVFNEPASTSVPPDWRFWLHGDADSRSSLGPVGMQALVNAIRSAGAQQLIAVQGFRDSEFLGFDASFAVPDPNIIYEVHPWFAHGFYKDVTDADRDAHFGFLAKQFPILAGEWGFIPGEDSANCRALPTDPDAAEQIIKATLAYFESRQISWTYASFLPGDLFIDFSDYYRTDLVEPWTCGGGTPKGLGLGEPVMYYLDTLDENRLAPVSGAAGNIVSLARGAITPIYGYYMAASVDLATGDPPLFLDGTSVRVTDSAGVSRLAGLRYISPFLVNAVVPENTALGTATFEIASGLGTGLVGTVIVQDISPGLYTAWLNGRGPVIADVTITSADGNKTTMSSYACPTAICITSPIPIPEGGATKIMIYSSGIRNRKPDGAIAATIGGFSVPVLSTGIQDDAGGIDSITLDLPPILKGLGETDLVVVVDGIASNAVRVNIL
jgi:uncharacterized protein (TIGR03437 family)